MTVFNVVELIGKNNVEKVIVIKKPVFPK